MWCTSAQPASARRPETRWRFHLSRCPGFGVHFFAKVGRQVRRVAQQLIEVVARRVVEGEARGFAKLGVERNAPGWIRSSAPSRRTRGRRIATFRPPSTTSLGAIDDCIVGDVVEPHPAHRPSLGPPRPRTSLRPRESHPGVIPNDPG